MTGGFAPALLAISLASGGFVGFTLGLIGSGGSILATPLLLYAAGLPPHQAIGTGALAVSGSAFANFAGHFRAGNVRWRCAGLFALVGMAAAAVGAHLGRMVDGNRLLALFALLMLAVGVRMALRRPGGDAAAVAAGTRYCTRRSMPRIVAAACAVGLLSGFFGIGGGFLVVPSLLLTTGMPMVFAVGTSLLSVGAFGVATASSYALAGLVDWPVAGWFLIGALAGGAAGTRLACRLGDSKALLGRVLAGLVCGTAVLMLYRSAVALGW